MTSIVIWANSHKDDFFPGYWAVSDSRVSSEGRVLTDNFQKLTALNGYGYGSDDFFRRRPRPVFSAGFACAGSTLISSAVREFMGAIVADLREMNYIDAPDLSFEDRTPSLEDVARLTSKVAAQYVTDLGQHYPKSARIEIALFGYCAKTDTNKVFKIQNRPESPASVTCVEVIVTAEEPCIMGAQIDAVRHAIQTRWAEAPAGSLARARAPISALADIAGDDALSTIGGALQLFVAGRFGAKVLPLVAPGPFQQRFMGVDLLQEGACLGGFSYLRTSGLSFPWRPTAEPASE